MAELTPLYMDLNSVYSGDELGLPWRDVIGEGIVGAGDLEVTQKAAGADLSVDVAAGAAWILGDTNVDAQPVYRVRNDAVVNKGISPDPSNPRIVSIIAQITDETFAGTGRTWEIQALHGTPAGSPVAPTLPDSALLLASIAVTAGDTSIVDAQITDSRVLAAVGSGQALLGAQPSARVYKAAPQSIPTVTLTAFTYDTERFDNDTIHDTGTNPTRLTCKTAGKYLIGGQVLWAVAAGGNQRRAALQLNGTTTIGGQSVPPNAVYDPYVNPSAVWDMAVNDYVEMIAWQDSGGALNASTLEFWMIRLSA